MSWDRLVKQAETRERKQRSRLREEMRAIPPDSPNAVVIRRDIWRQLKESRMSAAFNKRWGITARRGER